MDLVCRSRQSFLFFIGFAMLAVSLGKGLAGRVKSGKQKLDQIKAKKH